MEVAEFIREFLQCPVCRAGVILERDRVVCEGRDGLLGRVRDGIIDLLVSEASYREIPAAQMARILEVAEQEGWYPALGQLRPTEALKRDYVADLARADFRFLLPSDPAAVVLDLGCGLGTITQVFAGQSRLVVTVDNTWDRLRFAQLRLRQEGFTNVVWLHADVTQPWFKPGRADVALVNGLLEWLPLSRPGRPDRVQADFLAMVRQWLVPGGWILLGIENRYARSQLKGRFDPHSGLPGTAILPRVVSDWVVRAAARWDPQRLLQRMAPQREGYRTWIHSLPAYYRMLKKAGFHSLKAYIPLPSYHLPQIILPLDSDPALRWYLEDWWGQHPLRRYLIVKGKRGARILSWLWARTSEHFLFLGQSE